MPTAVSAVRHRGVDPAHAPERKREDRGRVPRREGERQLGQGQCLPDRAKRGPETEKVPHPVHDREGKRASSGSRRDDEPYPRHRRNSVRERPPDERATRLRQSFDAARLRDERRRDEAERDHREPGNGEREWSSSAPAHRRFERGHPGPDPEGDVEERVEARTRGRAPPSPRSARVGSTSTSRRAHPRLQLRTHALRRCSRA